jgi:hypothetical protein
LTAAGILGLLLLTACGGGFVSLLWQRLNAMGEGSARRAEVWQERLRDVPDPDAARQAFPVVVWKRFGSGEWVFGVCEDSHMNPNGGTIVLKDSRGRLRAFFGHVCGRDFLEQLLQHTDSLDGLYDELRTGGRSHFRFGEFLFPAEGRPAATGPSSL